MSNWRAGNKLLAFGRDAKQAVSGKSSDGHRTAVSTVAKRLASPQSLPIEDEGEGAFLRPALEVQPEASTSGRIESDEKQSKAIQEMFIYTMYKIRGKDIGDTVSRKFGRKSAQQHLDETKALLLPLRYLADDMGLGRSHWAEMYTKELDNEMEAIDMMGARLEKDVKDTMSRGHGAGLPAASSLIFRWREPLTAAIANEQRGILNSEPHKDRKANGAHMLLLDAEKLATTTLHGVMTAMLQSEQLGITRTVRPAMDIGRNVQLLVEMDMIKAKSQRINRQRKVLAEKLKSGEELLAADGRDWSDGWFEEWSKALHKEPRFRNSDEAVIRAELLHRMNELKPLAIPDPATSRADFPLGSAVLTEAKGGQLVLRTVSQHDLEKQLRTNAMKASKKHLAKLNWFLNRARQASQTWSQEKIAKIGVRLLDILIDSCYIPVRKPKYPGGPPRKQVVSEPAFSHEIQHKDERKLGVIKLHDQVTRMLNKSKDLRNLLLPAYQPMIIPPLPWRGVDYGGYLVSRSNVMRTRGFRAQTKALYEADRLTPGLSQVYDALNALGETGWRINRDMLAAIQHARDHDVEIRNMPRSRDLPIQLPPKRRRFQLLGGGFWHHKGGPTGRSQVFDEADRGFLQALGQRDMLNREALDDVFVQASSGSHSQSNKQDDAGDAQRERSNLMLQYDLDEGDTLTRGRPKRRGAFLRTQLLVTSSMAETTTERRNRRSHNMHVRKLNREQYSLRCDLRYKLEVAEKFKDQDAIYFPHNLDFRGRAYPMHPHLNHLGNDLCRGLLEFAEGKPLGQYGLEWLFVQLANTWGNGEDKKDFEGRRQFVIDHLQDVQESARQPYQNTWWQGAEAPWQFLAACKDVERALSSGNPEAYVSHTPVMMDGSCNGLQHYAALGLDMPGGRAVNLTDMDKPQDVYTEVAALVRERVGMDAAKGVELATLLLNEIDRKLVKQTVMTSVYGVTFVGARGQINSRLNERGYQGTKAADPYQTAFYAAQQTMAGLHQRFGEAKLVMQWLAESARAIAKLDQPVMWTTPLGLPVVQPYRKQVKVHVSTTLQRLVLVSDKKQDTPILKSRQRSAFPPNFIHSIDSSHMMMTASACKQAGLAFAGVHDSFWTHAASVPVMNCILREKFVELYKKPILEDLARQFELQYPGIELPPLPKKGSLDIEEVLRAKYFFS